jgi:hypothetical protein
MGVPFNLPPPQAGDRCWVPPAPSTPSPPLQGSLGRNPLPPSTELPLPPENYHLGLISVKNLVLASKSGSEIMVRTQDDRMEHFWPNGISLRGQAAELETSAG